jgi:hypothetical protein
MSVPGAVRDRLREQPLPGEAEAAARSWPVVEAALAERPGSVRRGRTPVRLIVVFALLCAGLATALSPAGAWIGDRFSDDRPSAEPAFAALPSGGSVLAISRSGAYGIRPDGGFRHLGAFTDAGWSPHGIHVVGVEGRRLVAVTAAGTVKWTLTGRRAVSHPAWSTGDGFAVAYLEGRALKVVGANGDPTTNRVLRKDAASVTPAWQPHSDTVLTYVTRAGAIETVNTETGRALWRTEPPPAAPRSLAWTVGGSRLVALRSHTVTVLDRTGHVRRTIGLPGLARELALHPSGMRAAVVIGNRVVEVGLRRPLQRQLFQGSVDGIAWSQDGRRLLVGWRNANQWLLLGPGSHVRALHGVSDELGARGGFPRVAGWCCAG